MHDRKLAFENKRLRRVDSVRLDDAPALYAGDSCSRLRACIQSGMRRLPLALSVLLLAPSARAAPTTLTADVEYSFIDQNGLGWARTAGRVTVTFTFAGTGGSLAITGRREWFDGRLTRGRPPRPNPDLTGDKWAGPLAESYPLHEVTVTDRTVSFKLDAVHDHLTGSCVPAKSEGIPSATLYECTITGFQWHPIAHLPELHHPILLDADPTAKLRILNSMTGKAKAGFGSRAVSLVKPVQQKSAATKP